jgi:hypothetical protein
VSRRSFAGGDQDPTARARIVQTYGTLPAQFEINRGQTDPRVKFLARGPGYNVFLTSTEAILLLSTSPTRRNRRVDITRPAERHQGRSAVVRMSLRGANAAPTVTGENELPATVNYLRGSDAARWHTNVPTYARVRYREIYPGIDLVYYGRERSLEYDFVVSPGAEPGQIVLEFDGADRLQLDAGGDLLLHTAEGSIRHRRPFIYQVVEGRRRPVAGRYVRRGDRAIGFRVGTYDRTRPIVIDPVVDYSTYLGGIGGEVAYAVAVEDEFAYVTGYTGSYDFPATPGAFGERFSGGAEYGDVFVAKLDQAGTGLIYATYLGGSGDEEGLDIAVRDGYAYVTGGTRSSYDFPVTPGAFDTTYNAGYGGYIDGFVTKLSPTGSSLVYSTYLGGSESDQGMGIAVDDEGRAHVTGSSTSFDFPTTPRAFDRTVEPPGDAFVVKLNPAGSRLLYSTALGGIDYDVGLDVAVDAAGEAYVSGFAGFLFPTTRGAYDETFNFGGGDGFVTKLRRNGTGLVYSTYVGGAGSDDASDIAVDEVGSVYVAGNTQSKDFPTVLGAHDPNYDGDTDAFVLKLRPSGAALAYSTFLGGVREEFVGGIALDRRGRAWVTGMTRSGDFPTTSDAADGTRDGDLDAFVTQFNRIGSDVLYSTYLGGNSYDWGMGIALDEQGQVYVTGLTGSLNFPTTPGAVDPFLIGPSADAFVTRFRPRR